MIQATRALLALVLAGMFFGLSGCGGSDAAPPAAAAVTAQPADTQVTQGANALFKVSASADGGELTYQWQRSNDGGSTWLAVAGATTNTLSLTAVTTVDSGAKFRVLVTGSGPQTTSSAVTLTVTAVVLPPAITVQPAAQQTTEGLAASFAVTATGTTLTYQWQRSDDGLTWTEISGATLPTLQLATVALSANGQLYRVLLRNTAATVTSDPVRLTVSPASAAPGFSTQPTSTSVTAPSPATFSAVVTGNPAPSLQWQRSVDLGASYADIAGATGPSYTTAATTLGDNGSLLRLRAINAGGTALSAAVTLNVAAALAAPTIQQQPQDGTLATGQTATWTVVSSGNPLPTYQWQISSDGGATFANINGATSASYSLVAAAGDSGRRVRVVVSNSQGSATSSAAQLTVAPAASAYLVAGVSSTGTNLFTLNIVDPAAPSTVLLAVDIDGVGNFFDTTARTFDATAQTVTKLGTPLVFFTRNHLLYQIAMAKPGTPTAQRISSQADVCDIIGVLPLDRTGLDAWVVMRTAGADGSCTAPADNPYALVRTGSSSSTAATVLAPGVSVIASGSVADSSGKMLWMLANDASVTAAPKLVAFSPTLAQVDVVGGAGIRLTTPLILYPEPILGPLMKADGTLRRLSADATGLSLSASSYTFTGSGGTFGAADGSNYYFPDGGKMIRVQGTSAPTVLATMPAGSGNFIQFTQNSTHLLTQQLAVSNVTVAAINKSTGAVVQLLAADVTTTNRTPTAPAGDTVHYYTASDTKLGDLRRIQTDGSGDALVVAGVFVIGGLDPSGLRTDVTRYFGPAPVTLYCLPAAGATDCRNGTLIQRDLATGVTVTLGVFSGSSGAPAWRGSSSGAQGLLSSKLTGYGRAAGAVPGYDKSDLWLYKAGQANSLVRVTSTMP